MRALAGMLFGNTVVGLVLTALFLMQSKWTWPALERALTVNLVMAHSIGGLCELTLGRLVPRFWHRRGVRWPLLVALLLAIGFVGSVLGVAVLALILPGSGWSFWRVVFELYRGAAVVTLLVGVGATVWETYRMEGERTARMAGEARLASLESRVHPHFLFNALNSISSLIREDPDRAERLVERLAALLRSSLDTQQESLIPLAREMELVVGYLEIQAARFGEQRLRFRLDVPEAVAAAARVPPFSVQTLVENAVKFAVAPRLEGGEVRVTAAAAGDRGFRITVSDDGPGLPAEVVARPPRGRGLDNLRDRLDSLFGRRGGLKLGPGAEVTMILPEEAEGGASARLPAG